jgi:TolB-like protein
LHGDILNRLSAISDLQVISRTSVRKYAHTHPTIRDIYKELHAVWVLEGEVQETDRQVRVNVRLINAKADKQQWARDYSSTLDPDSLFQIQGSITKKIASELKAELSPDEKRRVEKNPTESLSAYRLYAQGRSWLDQRTEGGMRRALDYFERAIREDPEYALSLVGLADTLTLIFDYGYEKTDEVLDRAEDAIFKALELDSELAEAHASMGLLHSNRYKGPDALRELKRAIEIRPGYAEAHNWLSWVHMLLGQPQQALESAKEAVKLDPLSPEAVSNLSLSSLINSHYEEALGYANRVTKLQPGWTTGTFYAGLAWYHMGKYNKAVEILSGLSVPWAGIGPEVTAALSDIALGNTQSARELLRSIRKKSFPFAEGLLTIALGDTDTGMNILMQINQWDSWPSLALNHFYPEYQNIIRKHPQASNVIHNMKSHWSLDQEDVSVDFISHHDDIPSIAVLPFASLGDKGNDIFVNGIHDDLLTRLSSISGITVTSRTSVMRYKETELPLKQISRELGVSWIVEGTVQQVQNQVKVRVRLVNTKTDRQQWSRDFENELTASPGDQVK